MSFAKVRLLNDPIDVDWVRTTALKRLDPPVFKSFEIAGNEDCPDNVCVYAQHNPTVFDAPLVTYSRNKAGHLEGWAKAAIK